MSALLRQFFGDDVRASRDVARKGGIEKNGLANVKFVSWHGAQQRTAAIVHHPIGLHKAFGRGHRDGTQHRSG
jgi:hypothetical protein